jgi:hypothetical protein
MNKAASSAFVHLFRVPKKARDGDHRAHSLGEENMAKEETILAEKLSRVTVSTSTLGKYLDPIRDIGWHALTPK